MVIARDEVISNADHGRYLPPSWRTLDELVRLKMATGKVQGRSARRTGIDKIFESVALLVGDMHAMESGRTDQDAAADMRRSPLRVN
jgi:hypothetical protein